MSNELILSTQDQIDLGLAYVKINKQKVNSFKSFLNKYNELKEYIDKNNSFPGRYDNLKLYDFITNVRYNFKHGKLSDIQINLLNDINFIWDGRAHRFEKMREYKLNKIIENEVFNGIEIIKNIIKKCWVKNYLMLKDHLKTNKNYPKWNTSLGRWVSRQRTSYKHQTLNKKQIKLLNKVDFKWSLLK
jgi:hypothetical protein